MENWMYKLIEKKHEELEEIKEKGLRINWDKSCYLCSYELRRDLKFYLQSSEGIEALRFNEQTEILYLFNLKVVIDPLAKDMQLAIVFEKQDTAHRY